MSRLSELLSLPDREKQDKGVLHTPGEIVQQPETWRRTFELFKARQAEIQAFVTKNRSNGHNGNPTVILTGAGTSDFVGQSLAHLIRRQWRCQALAIASTNLLTHLDSFVIAGNKYLCVSFSRSGDSPEGVAVVERLLDCYTNVFHLVVTCSEQGALARRYSGHPGVCCLVLDKATNDKGLAMTSSYSNMVVAGQCLAHLSDLGSYSAVLSQLVTRGEGFLEVAAATAEQLARESYRKICFLGSGALFGVARESALKVLELTAGRVCTFAETYLGLRHGPLSAIDKETLLVGFLSSHAQCRAYELDLLEEIRAKALARKRVVIACEPETRLSGWVDHHLIPAGDSPLPDEYRPPLDVMFGQLLGLFASLEHGLLPDSPSPSGVIARIVGKIKIYS
ncbi:MAG: SIS domain-containing protein [Acidobacteriota bacterium]